MKYSSEIALVSACKRYDKRAQKRLYLDYVDIMYNTVKRYCSNPSDIEDVLQDSFTKVFKSLDNFNPEKGKLKSWIRKIVINCALDFIAKKKGKFTNLDQRLELHDHEPLSLDRLSTDYIYLCIDNLPYPHRVIFNLYEIEGYSHDEIAQKIDINVHSSRVYLFRAKKQLKVDISNYLIQSKSVSV